MKNDKLYINKENKSVTLMLNTNVVRFIFKIKDEKLYITVKTGKNNRNIRVKDFFIGNKKSRLQFNKKLVDINYCRVTEMLLGLDIRNITLNYSSWILLIEDNFDVLLKSYNRMVTNS